MTRIPNAFLGHRYLSSDDSHDDFDSKHHILDVLRDVPPGCLTFRDIRRAEHALEEWASSHRRPTPETFGNAKFILSRLIQEQEYYLNSQEAADHYQVRSFLLNRVLDCWRKGWRNGALEDINPANIIAWVNNLEARVGMIPDNRGLTLIIDAICLRGNPNEAPLLAQWLLDQRLEYIQELDDSQQYEEDRSDDGDSDTEDDLRPDTIMISNVIRAWAKSDRIEAPEMAEGLLQLMHELYYNGWKDSGPNNQSFGVAMEAWYNSQRPEATTRILDLLEEMKHSNLEQVKPDRVCYQYAINALINSKSKTGMDQAYRLLQEMVDLLQAGNTTAAPNAYLFSRVMAGMAQQGDVDRMDVVLEQLQDLYAMTGDISLQPNDQCWKAYIIGKSKSGASMEAQGVLDELVDRAIASGNKCPMPSRGYFIDTLVSWTKDRDQLLAAQQSHNVLRRMIDLGKTLEFRDWLPDGKTFDKVILAWSRSRHASAPDYIEILFKEMETVNALGPKQLIRPSLMGYTNWMLAWERSRRKDAASHIRQIFEALKAGKHGIYPDKYTFGIAIKALAQEGQFAEAEHLLEDMIQDYNNGNVKVKPDMHLFNNLLWIASKRTDGNAVTKCEEYLRQMKALGLSSTVLSSAYLIDALSKSKERDTSSRAEEILNDTLLSHRSGVIPTANPKDYQLFLRLIADSCIPQRSKQARDILMHLPKNRSKVTVSKDLLPPLGSIPMRSE
jgi:pentatricopeptide repeat protein